jgi:hypothetical protein
MGIPAARGVGGEGNRGKVLRQRVCVAPDRRPGLSPTSLKFVSLNGQSEDAKSYRSSKRDSGKAKPHLFFPLPITTPTVTDSRTKFRLLLIPPRTPDLGTRSPHHPWLLESKLPSDLVGAL